MDYDCSGKRTRRIKALKLAVMAALGTAMAGLQIAGRRALAGTKWFHSALEKPTSSTSGIRLAATWKSRPIVQEHSSGSSTSSIPCSHLIATSPRIVRAVMRTASSSHFRSASARGSILNWYLPGLQRTDRVESSASSISGCPPICPRKMWIRVSSIVAGSRKVTCLPAFLWGNSISPNKLLRLSTIQGVNKGIADSLLKCNRPVVTAGISL